MKSGSSVIETISFDSGWGPLEARGVRSEARGEAVFVDLGGGRNVIAILGWGPDGRDTDKIYGLTRAALAPSQRVSWKDEPNLKGSGELPSDYIPTLITFSDLNDPKTARVVQPHDFPDVFGQGFRFRGAKVETTRDALTNNIEKKLPWVGDYQAETFVERRLRADAKGVGASMTPGTKFKRKQ